LSALGSSLELQRCALPERSRGAIDRLGGRPAVLGARLEDDQHQLDVSCAAFDGPEGGTQRGASRQGEHGWGELGGDRVRSGDVADGMVECAAATHGSGQRVAPSGEIGGIDRG
jgi:hypothetical protein